VQQPLTGVLEPSEAAPPSTTPPSTTPPAKTLPSKTERLSTRVKWAFATGGATDTLGHWLYFNLADPVYSSYFHLSPTQIGNVKAATLIADAFAGVLFGWLSDNTRSRWGRRRPFILVGSLLSGLSLPLLFLPSKSWGTEQVFAYMLLSAVLYSPLIAAYNSAYQALGAELTPDYHERANVMGYKAIVQKTVGILIGAAVWLSGLPLFRDPATGEIDSGKGAMAACTLAGFLMIAAGVINVLYVPERYYATATRHAKVGVGEMLRSTLSCKPFLVLLGVGFAYAIPTFAVDPLGYYAGYYYVLRDFHETPGAAYGMWGVLKLWGGVLYTVLGISAVYPAQYLIRRHGKRAALSLILAFGVVNFALSWVMYTPEAPWLVVLHTGLSGFCATGLWVVLPSMTADSLDYEEQRTGARREGAFSSSFFWATKAGMGIASILAGQALTRWTGFRAELGGQQSPDTYVMIRALFAGIPIVACLVALALLRLYPLSVDRMRSIRAELEARRGTV
jgi:GPH family glycoside/pentoside/hexuronide:cation symporter